jgi:hypothetical protein
MLLAAANYALAGQERDAFNELMEDFRARYGERSKLVHNLWGHSNDHPDKALWWRSADFGSSVAKLAAVATVEDLTQINAEEDMSLKAMLYSVKDLTDVAARLQEYTNRVQEFVLDLMNAHPVIAAAASAATNTPPIGDQPQLDLPPQPQTDP